MAKDIIQSPATPIASPPSGYKGGPGVYNGENKGEAGAHKRTSSPNAVPEKIYDGAIPSGSKDVVTADKLPKNI